MKKLYFQLIALNVGGVEKSLLNLIETLPRDKYDIHLGLMVPKGGYMSSIPEKVHVHIIDRFDFIRSEINDPPLVVVKNKLKKGSLSSALVLSILYLIAKISDNRYLFYKYIFRDTPQITEAFDIAISYAGPSDMVDFFVCEKVKAKEKYGWIHFDVSRFGIDKGMIAHLYKKYSKILIVSETAKFIFDRVFPQFINKTEVFHNIVSFPQVLSLAEKGLSFDDHFDGKRILTVGRISEEKGQHIAIDALKLILDKGLDVRWYFVGDGKDKSVCENLSKQLGISDRVVFLGAQLNPYAFMRDCDIYVQPSRHEGFCITLAEALCFGNPIVATEFTGAKEQLEQRNNGVVTGMSAEEIANGVIEAINKGEKLIVSETHIKNDISKLLYLF